VELHTLAPDAPAAAVERWDRFVADAPDATFFHRAGWRDVLVRSFGHAPHFLYAEEGGEIVGVLPLARMRSLLFGDALISTPFCVYGGVATARADVRHALEEAAVALGVKLGVDHVEFRNLQPRRADWVQHATHATFRKAIVADPDANLLAIPRKQRAEVRKGMERPPRGGAHDRHRSHVGPVRDERAPARYARVRAALLPRPHAGVRARLRVLPRAP
jgi:FemAB-related protein (PEP-CTERM system-associated)